ncbi:MAG TPA: hypothetical protein VGM53_35065 [Streptosporangiaceae bacterium]|jgi:hypothetical protein
MTDKIKREARELMTATGQSYTAARRAVARQAATALAGDGPPQLNRDPADAISAMLTMGFGQLMAAGARARAFPTVYPGGAGAVVREAVTPVWSQVIPGAVADVLAACAHTIVSRGGHEDILDGWGNCPVAAEMLASAARWKVGGPVRDGVRLTSPDALASSLAADPAKDADVLHGTWVLLALAYQRDPDTEYDGEYHEDDGQYAPCDECGGELWGKGTYGCSCWNPSACEECGDENGDCDCWI